MMTSRICIFANRMLNSISTPWISKNVGRIRKLHIENDVLLRRDDNGTGISTLTLNKPEKYNVLSWEMLDALQKELDDIAKQEVCIFQSLDYTTRFRSV